MMCFIYSGMIVASYIHIRNYRKSHRLYVGLNQIQVTEDPTGYSTHGTDLGHLLHVLYMGLF